MTQVLTERILQAAPRDQIMKFHDRFYRHDYDYLAPQGRQCLKPANIQTS